MAGTTLASSKILLQAFPETAALASCHRGIQKVAPLCPEAHGSRTQQDRTGRFAGVLLAVPLAICHPNRLTHHRLRSPPSLHPLQDTSRVSCSQLCELPPYRPLALTFLLDSYAHPPGAAPPRRIPDSCNATPARCSRPRRGQTTWTETVTLSWTTLKVWPCVPQRTPSRPRDWTKGLFGKGHASLLAWQGTGHGPRPRSMATVGSHRAVTHIWTTPENTSPGDCAN